MNEKKFDLQWRLSTAKGGHADSPFIKQLLAVAVHTYIEIVFHTDFILSALLTTIES